jgi:hypothetical protein
MKKIEQIKQSVERSAAQRKKLGDGNINFSMFPSLVFQKKLPEMLKNEQYKKQDARDAILLYLLYVSLVCRVPGHALQGTSYPSHDQITEKTGIHRSRIKKLNEILVKEKMIHLYRISYEGHMKNVYVPMYNF